MSTLRTYAQLCRLPAVFTAMADIFMGYAIGHNMGYFEGRPEGSVRVVPELAALLGCSSCLYLAGMVLNDVFDRHVDAIERPNRPIPSGRVPVGTAVRLALFLIAAGLICSKLAGGANGGFQPVLVALLLVVNILIYDGWAKNTFIGPVAMGSCRLLNVLLGAGLFARDLSRLFFGQAAMLGFSLAVYIAGVTWFAKNEAGRSGRRGLMFGLAVCNLGLALLGAWTFLEWRNHWSNISGSAWVFSGGTARGLAVLGVIALVINRRAISAVIDPSPSRVQLTVRTMLLSIITIDAVMIYATLGPDSASLALGVAALLIPSFVLGKWMSMT